MATNLKIHHTEYPAGRAPQVTNTIKEGGLWYADRQAEVLNKARFLVQVDEPKIKRKDEVRDFCVLVWEVIGVLVLISLFVYFTRII